MKSTLGVMLILAVLAGNAGADKAVFVRDDAIVVTKDDGATPVEIRRGVLPASSLRWSPDGTKIAYLIPGSEEKHPHTFASIVIVSQYGKRLRTIPILSTTPDGGLIAGMRFVENIQWVDNQTIMVDGTENPSTGIANLYSTTTRETKYLEGSSFTPCHATGTVAHVGHVPHFVVDLFERSEHLEFDGKKFDEGRKPDCMHGLANFVWSADCRYLAYTDAVTTRAGTGSFDLVIVKDRNLNSRVVVPRDSDTFFSLAWVGTTVVLDAGQKGLIQFATDTGRFGPFDQRTKLAWDQRAAKQQHRSWFEKKLGPREVNWWP
jgi:hypothetical protein